MLERRSMEALAAVIDEGGFERAAQKLHITQSAVSQRVKQLEEAAGQVLLIRSSPPRPTAAGIKVLKHCNQVRHLEADLLAGLNPFSEKRFRTLALGINADSIATWFFPAMNSYLATEPITLDLRVDDQDQTHKMLRKGEVLGCISSQKAPVQGCSVSFLGTMNYRLVATPGFMERWFSQGISGKGIAHAPLLVFNKKDELQSTILTREFGPMPQGMPIHYLPSTEKFLEFIAAGLAYGVVPDLQSLDLIKKGVLVDLIPHGHMAVDLFWHCWNLKSRFIGAFSQNLVARAGALLY
ncbi:MAG: LysR family transcriptional regulator ArgP [Desulfobacteraceae bacterium]|nr:LysR family transcriptional regulator ArgP [Desulfobacteraceae bacterium]